MQLKKLIDIIESFAPPELALEWDKCGIQVAGNKHEVKSMALALDPDEQTIQKAVDLQTDFLLTHHPLALKPRLPDRPDSFHRIIKNLLTADTTLYSAHTSLDINPGGPATWLAKKLKLNKNEVLDPVFIRKAAKLSFQEPIHLPVEDVPCRDIIIKTSKNIQGLITEVVLPPHQVDLFLQQLRQIVWPFNFLMTESPKDFQHYGLGFTGSLPEAVTFEMFTDNLKNILGLEKIIQIGDAPEKVQMISCCPGSGGDLACKAFHSGAQVFITGDMKYHQGKDSSEHGCVLDVGHFILEEKMMFEWFLLLKHQIVDMDIYFIEGKSPFKIL
ncbi:MAG: Nif3-like dinuclear metal center hexameric protein [Desulfonatronovibrio sp.]